MLSKHSKLISKHLKVLNEIFSENPDISSAESARVAISQYGVKGKSEDYLRSAISDFLRSGGKFDGTRSILDDVEPEEDVSINTEDDTKYEVAYFESKPHYQWETGRGSLKFSVEFIDQLFYEYSKHGLNMSQTEMINKHGFKVWEWTSIKSVLWLFKNSNVFSPHTVEITPKKDLESMISEKMEQTFSNPQTIVEKQYNKQLNKAHKQVLQKQWEKDFMWQKMMVEIADSLPKAVSKKQVLPKVKSKKDVGTIVVPIADMHVGAKVTGLRGLRDYDLEVAKQSMRDIVKSVNDRGASRVCLAFVGDLIESFTGMNHPNSWQSMEWGMYGAKVIANAYECIEILVNGINNLEEVWGVGGNHDRGDSSKKHDTRGEMAGVIFYFMERMYGEHINVIYDDFIVSREVDGIMYILTHGDDNIAAKSKKGKDIVLKYGDNSMYNIIMTGHWHTRELPHDDELYRWLICPSVFTGNDYSRRLGFGTNPGFLQIDRKLDGKVRVLDESL